MSYTSIYAVWPGERHEEIAELRNGNLSAPIIWGEMYAKYVDGSGEYPKSAWMFHSDRLWPIWKRADIPKHQRAVLAMTYDHAYVARENYARAAADIRATITDLAIPEHMHWEPIAKIFESNPDCPAIGFNWTSVNEDPFQGPYNEETEEYGQPDWEEKWEMYAALDGLDKAAA